MPDKREHRGPHPKDRQLFAASAIARLQQAAHDFSLLLSRSYNSDSALKFVGDHFQLEQRQRLALARACCSDAQKGSRVAKKCTLAELGGRPVSVDGFNALITLEAALGGGIVLCSRDNSHRDLASVHGTYKHVSETGRAIDLLCDTLTKAAPASVCIYLDSPVSNSGRLAGMLRAKIASQELGWQVELVRNADREVIGVGRVVASSDAWVLDAAEAWLDLPGELLQTALRQTWLVDFRDNAGEPNENLS